MLLPKHFKLIACEILFREICYCVSQSRNMIDMQFMSKGLHDLGDCKMVPLLQAAIDVADDKQYDAILLGYGLCNNGIRSLHAALPLVVPRAHDCITLLLGSKEQYDRYFDTNPGTFFKSPGWVERDFDPNASLQSIPSQLGIKHSYPEYEEKYGSENARYLMESLGDWFKNYRKLAYIDTGFGDFQSYKELTKQQADNRGWEYEELSGSVDLLQRLLDGKWDPEDFLVVPPGYSIQALYDRKKIIGYE
ncbi:MAG TPA: hypothetical protein DDW50_13630 [Firmicutes bacterium]|nr:hypothetical protein [Bacillota bacterium]